MENSLQYLHMTFLKIARRRAETRALVGGGVFISSPDAILMKSTLITTDFKQNSSGRTRCSSLW